MADATVTYLTKLKGAQGVKSGFNSIGSSIGKTVAGYASLAVVGTSVLSFFKDSIQKQIEQDKIFRRLSTSIELAGQNYKSVEKDISKYLDTLQKTTEYGDTDSAQVLTTLTQLTGNYGKSLNNLELTLDLAATGLFDTNTAARMMGQALAGNVEILGRYIPELRRTNPEFKNLKTNAEKADYAIKLLNEKFGGTAQKNAETYAGKMKKLSNRFGDIQEKFAEIGLSAADDSGYLDAIETSLDNLHESWWNLIPVVNLWNSLMKETAEDSSLEKMQAEWQKWVDIGNNLQTTTDETAEAYQEYKDKVIEAIEAKKQETEFQKKYADEILRTVGIQATSIEQYKELSGIYADHEKKLEKIPKIHAKVASTTDSAYGEIQQKYKGIADSFTNTWSQALLSQWNEGQSFFDNMARGFEQMLASMMASMIGRLALFAAFSLFPGGSSLLLSGSGGNLQNFLFGFQSGGSFMVGGSGGPDSQVVAFRASPGEQVTVQTPSQQIANNSIVVNFYDSIIEDKYIEKKVIPKIKRATQIGRGF